MSKLPRVKLRIFLHGLWSIRSTVRAGLKTFDLQLGQIFRNIRFTVRAGFQKHQIYS